METWVDEIISPETTTALRQRRLLEVLATFAEFCGCEKPRLTLEDVAQFKVDPLMDAIPEVGGSGSGQGACPPFCACLSALSVNQY